MITTKKKQRGQCRRLNKIFEQIDQFKPYINTSGKYEHFHAYFARFIDSKKTNGKVKTAFIKKWLSATERFIDEKPDTFSFCKVAAVICTACFSESQIIIFYDEDYYNTFWDRNNEVQKWVKITDFSLNTQRNIETALPEKGYLEFIMDDENIYKDELWFYGEI